MIMSNGMDDQLFSSNISNLILQLFFYYTQTTYYYLLRKRVFSYFYRYPNISYHELNVIFHSQRF